MPSNMDSQDALAYDWPVRVDFHGNQPQQCKKSRLTRECDSKDRYSFNLQEISNFFQSHIGCKADHVTELLDGGKKWIRLSFNNEDAQKKALSVSGLPMGGATLHVSILSRSLGYSLTKPRSKLNPKSKRSPDTRRNLYVLNLPHDLSEQAYYDLFTPHGSPTHVVLLKTYDSCSRRRGFVVMSTHEEAREVITWLDGVCLQGFQLRVTWANIDRSNGFMSGYDRTSLAQDEIPFMRSLPSSLSTCSKGAASSMDVNTIVASNIPLSLFSRNEIEILFKPFGEIRNIQTVPSHPPPSHPLVTLAPASPLAQTAIVTFENANDAIAAKNTLHGQVYEGFTLAVGFVANLGRESSLPSKVSGPKPLASSTNSAAHCTFNQPTPLSPMLIEHTPQGLSLPSYDAIPFQYAMTFQSAFSQRENWMPYSAILPQASFNYQLQPTVVQAPVCSGENTNRGTSRQRQTTNAFMAYLTHQAATRG